MVSAKNKITLLLLRATIVGIGIFCFVVLAPNFAVGAPLPPLIPNDPSFSSQWNMTKIQAPEAWGFTTGTSSVRIAILDTGIDLDHEDLQAKIVASINFTDSVVGINDIDGHGTHVAGIAASITNNALGVAGVGFDASILNAKVVNDDNFSMFSWVANGIDWAVDNGADVINISWVAAIPSLTLETAVNDAWAAGVVIIGGAGNSAGTAKSYPAFYDNVIAVTATEDDDVLWSRSRYGSWVDVVAPGVGILSTYKNNGYISGSGTSMAAPHVAGLAALLFAVNPPDTNGNGRINDEIRAFIENNSVDISALNPGRPLGGGRIDAFKAVQAAVAAQGGSPPPPPPPDTAAPVISNISVSNITTSTADITWLTDEASDSQVEYGLSTSYGSTTTLASLVTSHLVPLSGLQSNTIHHFRVKSKDAAGNATTSEDQIFTTLEEPPPPPPPPPAADTAAPVISNIQASDITQTSAVISWDTDEDSTSQIEYGTDTTYGSQTPEDSTPITSHSQSLAGLSLNITYHYRVISRDLTGNESKSFDFTFMTSSAPDITSSAPDMTFSASDTIPPNAVTSLSAILITDTSTSATLEWAAPGDDGNSGTAASYIIKYSTTSLSDANWLSAAPFSNALIPVAAGLTESITITGLNNETTYYLAIKTLDEAGNESAISNVVIFTTLEEKIAPKAASVFSENSLIRAVGNEKVYVIKNGKKVWIPTAEAFIEAGYDWSDIQEVSASDVALAASGNLIRIESEPEIYVITGNKKRHVPTAETFVREGYDWNEIVTVPRAHGIAYKTANLLRVSGDPRVYIVERGLKRHIPNPKSFASYNYKWKDIIEVTAQELAGYKNAVLMRVLDDFKVYLLEGSTKRWIKTAEEFNSAGYDWKEVLDVSRTELESYETKEGAAEA